MENNKTSGQKQIAGAILIVGVLIAGAILLKGNKPANLENENNKKDLENLSIVISPEDHIIGNKNAKVVIVEYSDTECPFCKVFQGTMQKVMQTKSNDIAWVYRHYPIAQLHKKAFNESLATECAFEQGGNEMFWKYLDEVYLRTQSNDKLDSAELPKIATSLGLNIDTFNTCLSDQRYATKVNSSMEEGSKIGVSGTPKSFILKKGKVVDTIDGAYPYEQVIQKIDAALK